MRGIYFSRVIARDEGSDAPPCIPLPIVKRVFLGSRTGQGFEKKRRGCKCTPSVRILHPLSVVSEFPNFLHAYHIVLKLPKFFSKTM